MKRVKKVQINEVKAAAKEMVDLYILGCKLVYLSGAALIENLIRRY